MNSAEFELQRGTVHALVGENGAGKSTLLKIIGGAIGPDAGSIELDGKPVTIETPRKALDFGITIIHQELQLVPQLSSVANVFLGAEITKNGLLDENSMTEVAISHLKTLGFDRDPLSPVHTLSIAQRQIVEIARAFVRNSSIIAFDEPTATLTPHETENLFERVKELKTKGIGIILVTHRLDEIEAMADQVTVLRDGTTIWTGPSPDVTEQELIRLMVGRSVEYERVHSSRKPEPEPLIELQDLAGKGFTGISLDIFKGEILGIAGLVGSGRSEIVRAIAGIDPPSGGTLLLKGEWFRPTCPSDSIGVGIVYLPEDRKRDGLVPTMTVKENASLPTLDSFSRLGWVDSEREARSVSKSVSSLRLQPPDINRIASTYSGGNQQKIVLSKWLMTDAEVLIFDEPTRGVDVRAKVELHGQIRSLADEGKAVVLISSELPEIFALSDRIAIMRDGRLQGCLNATETSPEEIMTLAVGGE